MKRILILSYYYPGFSKRGGQRIAELFCGLKNKGFSPLLIVPTVKKEYFDGGILAIRDYSFSSNRLKFWQQIIWLCLRLVQEFANFLQIPFSIIDIWTSRVKKKIAFFLKPEEIELLIVSYPPLEILELALELKKRFNWKLLTDFRDGLLFEPVEKTKLERFKFYYQKAQKIERSITKESSAIVTVSPPIEDYFKGIYSIKTVVTIPNGFRFQQTLDHQFTAFSFSADCFNIVHTGSFDYSRRGEGIGRFLETIAELNEEKRLKPIKLHLAGLLTRKEKKEIRPFCRRGDVVYYGFLPREKALAMQRKADLLLVLSGSKFRSVATGKIFEYLLSRKPILNLGEANYAAQILAQTRCGWSINPLEKEKLKNFLIAIVSKEVEFHPDWQQIAAYNWDKLIEQWMELIACIQSLN